MKKWLPLLLLFTMIAAPAAVWQWSDDPGIKNARNYLWIPEDCKRVRGVLLIFKNLNEGFFGEDPLIRQVCREERLGIVYLSQDPRSFGRFADKSPLNAFYGWYDHLGKEDAKRYGDMAAKLKKSDRDVPPAEKTEIRRQLGEINPRLLKAGEQELDRMLLRLADISGYPELARAPMLVISHSMGGLPTWFMPFYMPERIWGAIPFKTGSRGGAPENKPDGRMDGVPVLYINQCDINGPGNAAPKVHWAGTDPGRKPENNYLIGRVFDWGGTHFDYSPELAKIAAMFIRKAARLRLCDEIPADGSRPVLKKIAPGSGYLATSLADNTDAVEIAPEPQYRGDKRNAFWFFDKEMAEAAVNHFREERNKKPQSLGVKVNGKEVDYNLRHWGELTIDPAEAREDGVTFQLEGYFRPDRKAGKITEPVGHGDPTQIQIQRTGSASVEDLGGGKFRLTPFNSIGFPNHWLIVHHPGDREYARSTYQIHLPYPDTRRGKPQKITFDRIADVEYGTPSVKLQAKSDIPDQRVDFYVISGPAEVKEGNLLQFAPIPPNAKFPVKVMVMAYQPGRLAEPKIRNAFEVQEFNIVRANFQNSLRR